MIEATTRREFLKAAFAAAAAVAGGGLVPALLGQPDPSFELLPWQRDALEMAKSGKRFAFTPGRRSGKTFFTTREVARFINIPIHETDEKRCAIA